LTNGSNLYYNKEKEEEKGRKGNKKVKGGF
jgi:hypothetical protein